MGMYNIADFYMVSSSRHPVFAGNNLAAYLSDETGTYQVFLADITTGKKRQLTNLDDRVTGLYRDKIGDNLIFTGDCGGDENDQIYTVSIASGEVKNLTNNRAVKFGFGAVYDNGKKILLSSNARNPAHYDICSLDISSGSVNILVENNDNYNNPAALSPDGKYFLYNKEQSADSVTLWMLNMQTLAAERIFPQGGEAVFIKPCFVRDSGGFYMVTNWNSDFTYIAYYDIKKKTLVRVIEKSWDIEDIDLSFDNRYLAFTMNEDGYTSLHILNLETGSEENIIAPPKCSSGGLVFSKDSYELLFDCASVKRPLNVWLFDLRNDVLRRLTDTVFSNINADILVEPELRRYSSFDGLSVAYWLYKKPDTPANAPVIIQIHGGPESQELAVYKPLLAYLVAEGFVIAAPNVRGSSGYGKKYCQMDNIEKRMNSVKDIQSLVNHLIEKGLAVRGKIGVMGGSYGGFMTLACIANFPEMFSAAVDTVGIVNFETFLENTSEYRRPHRESEYGSLKNHRNILRAISPIHKIADIKTPLMVIHGQNDPRVPVSEAEQLVSSLRGRGVAVEYLCYPDEGHGIKKRANQLDCYPKVAAFLRKHLE